MSVISFKKANCKNCYRCIKVCPIKAIRFNDDVQAEIMPVDCVLCGHCLEACPQNAKTITNDVGKIKEMIRSGNTVIASLAPSFLGSFDLPEPGCMVTALQKLGFTAVAETAEGAVQVSREYRKLIEENSMENIITTCCPTINDLIEKYYPSLIGQMAPVVSPMIAHGRMIKKQHEDAKVIFVGPCLSKKQEAEDIRHDTAIDAVLTFEELSEWFKEAGIDPKKEAPKPFSGADPAVARMYPITDGIINTVEKLGGLGDYEILSVSGMKECMDLLEALQSGEIKNCFIEINACTGGCIYGPAVAPEQKKKRFGAHLDIKRYASESEGIALSEDPELNLAKHMVDRSRAQLVPTEEQIREILRKIGKETPEQELNCGFCGYNSCREKAIAVFQNKAQLYMCLPYMNGLAQSMSNVILAESPNIIIAVDSDLKICELNRAAETAFRVTRSEAVGHYLCEYIDADNFDYVLQTHNDIIDMRVSYPVYDLITEQSLTYVPEQQIVIGIFRDVTEEQQKSQKSYQIKVDTVEMAQKVISKQMMVAQQIASLLGETTAETKATLTKLKDMIVYDGEEKTMNIHVDVAYKSLNKKGEELCGDKVEIVRTPDSVIMVLADGLGSGVKANILSTLTSKIIVTMLKEGAPIEDAVETIANTLPICEVRKLAYSTFSILQIYNDGRAYLVEFDNPTCVFVRDSALMDLPFEFREIAQKSVRECRFEVKVGDVLTLMSDGVIHAGVGALLNLGFKWENVAAHMLGTVTPEMTAARLASSLSQVCDSLYMGKPGDDTTVLTARIMPRKVVNLFSGPPRNKEDDERLVREFMREPGKHVVCGGTGGNIVSRVLNRPLKVSLGDYVDTGIPPIAYLQGIDLVTEGVLTISKTIELIKQQVENDMDDTYFKGLDAKNGAAMLARLLLEECTSLNLFIGKAINAAHQNPNLPIDLSIKLRLLDELADLLTKLGKKVEKRYY